MSASATTSAGAGALAAVLGEAASWAVSEPPAISLFPDSEGTIRVRVRPPRSPQISAGEVPLGIKVIPREDSTNTVVEEALLQIGAFSDLTAQLVPRTSRASISARHNLAVDNRGNTRVPVALSASDPDSLLAFKVKPDRLLIGPGLAAFAKISVRPRKRFLLGAPQNRPFQVLVRPDTAQPVTLDGSLLQGPLVARSGAFPLLAVAAAVAALAAIVLSRPGVASGAVQSVAQPINSAVNAVSDAAKSVVDAVAPKATPTPQPAGSATAAPTALPPPCGPPPAATAPWSQTGTMCSARIGHTATLLQNGQILAAGGMQGTKTLGTAELYDPKTRTWRPVGNMSTPRGYHTATLLGDGRVLVAGGKNDDQDLSTAEIYDPKARTWSAAKPMNASRSKHTATFLPKDRVVLVVGGNSAPPNTASAEVYDPVAGTWSATDPMSTPGSRQSHTATLLSNGKVLVIGGRSIPPPRGAGPTFFALIENATNSAELYDPSSTTKHWSNVRPMSAKRSGHTATLFTIDKVDKVLVAGGRSEFVGPLATAELYDSASGTWSPAGSMSQARFDHTATLIGSQVLVVGGSNPSGPLTSTEFYDSAKNAEPAKAWREETLITTKRTQHTATSLADGRVLVAGGTVAPAGGTAAPAAADLYMPPKPVASPQTSPQK